MHAITLEPKSFFVYGAEYRDSGARQHDHSKSERFPRSQLPPSSQNIGSHRVLMRTRKIAGGRLLRARGRRLSAWMKKCSAWSMRCKRKRADLFSDQPVRKTYVSYLGRAEKLAVSKSRVSHRGGNAGANRKSHRYTDCDRTRAFPPFSCSYG